MCTVSAEHAVHLQRDLVLLRPLRASGTDCSADRGAGRVTPMHDQEQGRVRAQCSTVTRQRKVGGRKDWRGAF